jgi:serine/threonine-protein phosphatase 5
MDCFRTKARLEKDTILNLIYAAQQIFESQPSLIEINLEEGEKITVCGDIHGQLFELLEIFKLNGNPREKHLYLFNGDFVDRGPCSIEVAVILYAYKLLYPEKFIINRGNHETVHEYVGEDFKKECLEKYDEDVFKAFSNSFWFLPLAAVIGRQYFVVHGGPSVDRDFAIDDIRALRRPGGESDLTTQLLWNDPVMPEEKSKTTRGGGKLFGPSVVDAFLMKEGLSMII